MGRGEEEMAAMDMDDEEDIWANTSSPSTSPPAGGGGAAAAGAFISTQLSLNSRLHLLSSAAAAPPDDIYAAAGGFRHHLGLGGPGAGGFRNAAASPAPFFPYDLADAAAARVAPLDAGAARTSLEHEMCLGPGAAGAAAAAAAWPGGADRRKKRMIKNRESAARSRARKQAYVRQLEREVELLQQENNSLRLKYEQLRVSVEVPVPVKKTLKRMPSAPF